MFKKVNEKSGKIVSLRICPGTRQSLSEVEKMSLVTGEGIVGDSHRLGSVTKHYSRIATVTTKPDTNSGCQNTANVVKLKAQKKCSCSS